MHKASFDASCRTSAHCKQHSADCIHLHTSSHPGWIRMLLCWLEQLSRQQPQTPRLPMFCILTSSRQHICPHVRASLTPLCPYPGATLPTLQLCLTQGCCCAGRFQQLPKRHRAHAQCYTVRHQHQLPGSARVLEQQCGYGVLGSSGKYF